MASYNPVVKNASGGAILYTTLFPRTTTGQSQDNPTLASGDVKISIDGGSYTNLGTLPTLSPSGSDNVKIVLSQSETNGDNLTIRFRDASGAEWCDQFLYIETVAGNFDSILDDTDLIDDGTSGLAKIATDVAAILVDTADMQPKIGTPAGASVSADIAAVKSDTAAILTDTGTTLDGKIDAILTDTGTDIPATLSTIAGYIDSEVAAIVSALGTPSNLGGGATIAANLANMAGATFDASTDSQEAIRNRGDSAWITATGFSTHSASDVWAVSTRTLSALDEDSTTIDLDATIRGAIGMAEANLDGILGGIVTTLGIPALSISDDIAAVKSDTGGLEITIGSAGAGLTAIPWNAAWDAEVQSEAADALIAYDPPTKAELDSAVAPLATSADLATVAGYIDTEVAAIKAKTDNLPTDPADASVIAARFDTLDTSVADLPTNAELATALDAIPTAIENADALLNRDMATGTDSGSTTVRTVRQALRLNRNKVEISGGTMTVYKEDDSTTSWTSAITTDGAAEPITASDPAGP